MRGLDAYIERTAESKSPVEGNERGNRDTQMDETMMLGLRLTEGVSFASFTSRFGTDLRAVYRDEIARLVEQGLIELGDRHVRLTERGRLLANRVFAAFLRSDETASGSRSRS